MGAHLAGLALFGCAFAIAFAHNAVSFMIGDAIFFTATLVSLALARGPDDAEDDDTSGATHLSMAVRSEER